MRALSALLIATAGPCLAQSPVGLDCALEPGPSRAVARIVDGMTVELDDRKVVRLIGLLAPGAADVGAPSGTWPPEQESRAALAVLVQGRTVVLAFAGPRADRYERVQAHLFVGNGEAMVWVQGRMAETGQARVFAPPAGEACVGELLAREAAARSARLGLWANAAYHVRAADRPTELLRYRGTFQLIAGRIESVGGSRARLVLDLASAERPAVAGSRARGGLRIAGPRSLEAVRRLGNPRALVGRDIIVRGWIEATGGPVIAIVAEGQLSVVGAEGQPGPTATGRGPGEPRHGERPAAGPPGVERR
jgi:endonuclease YncB( thermonuclease family)